MRNAAGVFNNFSHTGTRFASQEDGNGQGNTGALTFVTLDLLSEGVHASLGARPNRLCGLWSVSGSRWLGMRKAAIAPGSRVLCWTSSDIGNFSGF